MKTNEIKPAVAGLVIGLVGIVMFLLYYFTGLIYERNVFSFIPIVITIVLVIVFINMWAKARNNAVTYGNLFGYGFKTTCIYTLIVFFFTLLFIYLFPDYQTHMLDMIKTQMRQNPQLTDEQRDKGMEMVSKWFMISTLGGGLFFNVLVGTIASLIGAAIPKKVEVNPFSQIDQIGKAHE